ncbi:MAG TPA: copper resistance protein CopC [Dongiaceae bacterium]|nr:copper resistance protein CopC [Dongiaceae bacterium]
MAKKSRQAKRWPAALWPVLRPLACLALLFIWSLACSGLAKAHAVLEQSVPADRSVEAAAPRQLTLQFDEPVGVTELRLVDETGKLVPLVTAAKNNLIQATIADPLADGTYTIAYRVISADGHPVAGAVQFQIGSGASHWVTQRMALAWWQWGEIGARLLLYLAGFTFCGLGLHALRRGTDRSPLAAIASLAVISAACLLIGFQGAGVTGDTATQLLSRDLWRQGGAGPDGRTAVLFVAVIALGWLARYLRAQRRLALGLMIICMAMSVLAISTAGHVAVLGWLQMSVLTIHVLIALIWVASLAPLWKRLGRSPSLRPASPLPSTGLPSTRRMTITRRLSLLSLFALASGIVLACWQILEPAMMVRSAYGLTLTAKIIAVCALIAATIANQRLARRHAAQPRDQLPVQPRGGQFYIWAQLSLLAVTLGLTAALSQLTPPRHLLAAAQERSARAAGDIPLEKVLHAGDAMATIRLQAAGDGHFRLTAEFSSMAGQHLRPQAVTAELSNLDAHIGPLIRVMKDDGDAFAAAALDLVPAGRWRISVKADLDDFDRRDFTLEVVLRP